MGGEGREFDMQDIERAKEIISVHDPRYLNPDQMATLAVNQGGYQSYYNGLTGLTFYYFHGILPLQTKWRISCADLLLANINCFRCFPIKKRPVPSWNRSDGRMAHNAHIAKRMSA